MPTIRVEAQLSPDQLLRAVEQLNAQEFDAFLRQVITLWAQRQDPKLSAAEKKLLRKINEGLPEQVRQRYGELIVKRDAETLTPQEHKELLRLTDLAEERQAERVAALAQLARKRNAPLAKLMADLRIAAPGDD
jgi:hypothetical protein